MSLQVVFFSMKGRTNVKKLVSFAVMAAVMSFVMLAGVGCEPAKTDKPKEPAKAPGAPGAPEKPADTAKPK